MNRTAFCAVASLAVALSPLVAGAATAATAPTTPAATGHFRVISVPHAKSTQANGLNDHGLVVGCYQRLVLPLDHIDSSGNTTAEDLFVADTATGTLRVIPGKPLRLIASPNAQGIQMVGSWDRQGLLWVLAASAYDGYYQLGFWTGAGPLRAFAPAQGSPMALSAPGSG